MTLEELIASAEAEKRYHNEAVDATIAEVRKLYESKGAEGYANVVCQLADAVNETFRFELLDFMNEHGLRND